MSNGCLYTLIILNKNNDNGNIYEKLLIIYSLER